MPRRLFYGILFTLVALGAFSEEAKRRRLEEVVSAEALLYISTSGLSEMKTRTAESALYKIYQEPEVKNFLSGPEGVIKNALRQAEERIQLITFAEIAKLFQGESALALLDLQKRLGEKGIIHLLFVIDASQGKEKIETVVGEWMARLQTLFAQAGFITLHQEYDYRGNRVRFLKLGEEPHAELYYAYAGHLFLVATTRADLQKALDLFAEEGAAGSLARDATFQAVKEKLGRADLCAYLNVKQVLERFGPGPTAKERRVLQTLGLDKGQAASYALRLEDGSIRETLRIALSERSGLLALLPSEKATLPGLSSAPADTLLYIGARANLRKVAEDFLALLQQADHPAAEEARRSLAALEQTLGMKPEELLNALGPELQIQLAMPAGGGWPDLVLLAELREMERLKLLLEKIPNPESFDYRGEKVYSFKLPEVDNLVRPSLALLQDKLLFASTPLAMKRALARMGGAAPPGLAEQEDYKRVTAKLPESRSGLLYLNLPRAFEVVYNLAAPFVQNRLKWDQFQLDPALLPESAAVSRHLSGVGFALSSAEREIMLTSYSPISAGEFTLLAAAAAFNQREQRRGNRQRQADELEIKTRVVGDALQKYRQEKGAPPAKLSDLYPQYVKDLALFACPGEERALANAGDVEEKGAFGYLQKNALTGVNKIVLYVRPEKAPGDLIPMLDTNGKMIKFTRQMAEAILEIELPPDAGARRGGEEELF